MLAHHFPCELGHKWGEKHTQFSGLHPYLLAKIPMDPHDCWFIMVNMINIIYIPVLHIYVCLFLGYPLNPLFAGEIRDFSMFKHPSSDA